MAFMLSPGVQVTEKDLTNVVPAVATSNGAYAGVFRWGPVMDPIIVASENELARNYGAPSMDSEIATSFFTAANFLSYSNSLLLVRLDTTGQLNAVATATGGVDTATITTDGAGYTVEPTVTVSAPDEADGINAVLEVTIAGGAIDSVTIVEPGSGYSSAPSVTITPDAGDTITEAAVIDLTIDSIGVKINNVSAYDSIYSGGGRPGGIVAAKYPGTLGNSISFTMADSATYDDWDHKGQFDGAPGTGELHVMIYDEDGKISGTAGTVLEKFAFVSKSSTGRRSDGTNSYYGFVLNNSSKWVWWLNHPASMTDWGDDGDGTVNLSTAIDLQLSGGADNSTATEGNKQNGFSLFANSEAYDISLIIAGKCTAATANYIITNVAEVRKDCVAFVSPIDTSTGEVIVGVGNAYAQKIIAYKTAINYSSSYAVMDSGFKYQYDRYNDVYRWVPLNADVAGLCARTDFTDDPWFSPGGYNRGQIKGVVKLSFNPDQTSRDELYKNGVNPVVSFPGQGTVLYGDKTLLAKPSAFDRINVRRLFIVLEKAIAIAAKYQLFEFNDQFTRAQFRSLVEPFLRDVQGRRGVTDFRVVCDETNNTGEVIDTNRFVADIYIKPARSINFITLNFIAVRTGVSFEEIGA